MWIYNGSKRPPFADQPGPGQESVWDYPRPPAVAPDARFVRVESNGRTLAATRRAVRILETAGAPTFYIAPEDIDFDLLSDTAGQSFCEWKGLASYLCLRDGAGAPPVGWYYRAPTPDFLSITDFVSFYPSRVDCWVDDERVRPQPGGFYGGWVTSEIVGPIKGEPGTEGW